MTELILGRAVVRSCDVSHKRFRWLCTGVVAPASIAVLVALSACSESPAGPETVTSLAIVPSTIQFTALGATASLEVEARGASGQIIQLGTVGWASGDTTVATVDASGMLTSTGEGTATITAAAGAVTAQATVAVEQVVRSVQMTAPRDTLWSVGDTVRVVAEPQDSLGQIVSSAVVSWTSSDPNTAMVDSAGLVTAVAAGATDITAAVDTVESTPMQLAVTLPVDTIEVTPLTADFTALGQTATVTASALDVNGDPVPGAVVTWDSDTPAVAAVDGSGVVTAADNGTAAITASSQGVTSEAVTVTVAQVIVSADITPDASTVIDTGAFITFTATARDANGYAVAGPVFTWDSDTPSVAGVDANGRAKTLSDGSTVLTATYDVYTPTATLTVSQPPLRMASDPTHTCILDTSSRIQCWIEPSQTPVVAQGGYTWRSLAVGYNTCGITDANDAYCWAATDSVPVAAPGGLKFRSLSVGVWHYCGVTLSYDAYCWGVVNPSPVLVPGGHEFQSISSSQAHNCAVTTDNDVYCWGDNSNGQLGDGTGIDRTDPVLVSGGLSVQAVSAGSYGTCAVTTGNDGYCWGYDVDGVLGIGPLLGSWVPAPVVGGHKFQSIEMGDWLHSCGVLVGGGAYCWGSDSYGQLGDDGLLLNQYSPVPVAGGETFLTQGPGYLGSCGASATTVYCWGSKLTGQPLDTTAVLSYAGLQQTAAGATHSCGLTPANEAYCWGSGDQGQLGNGDFVLLSEPVAVIGGHAFQSLSAAERATCGLTTAERVYCWGTLNQSSAHTPQQVVHDTTFQSVDVGEQHACAVDARQHVLCWGVNDNGQLGDGTTTDHIDPVRITGVDAVSFTSVAAGVEHSCAVATTNDMYCWGDNSSGELGTGNTTSSTTPVLVSGSHAFQAVTVGMNTCGLTTANDAYCWGSGDYGMIGDGMQVQRETPALVTGGLSFQAIASTWEHTCGLTTGNALYCWGQNTYAQLGDGTVSSQLSPTPVSGGLTFQSIAAGLHHSCAVTMAGDGMCWGERENGQIRWDIIQFTPLAVTIVP